MTTIQLATTGIITSAAIIGLGIAIGSTVLSALGGIGFGVFMAGYVGVRVLS